MKTCRVGPDWRSLPKCHVASSVQEAESLKGNGPCQCQLAAHFNFHHAEKQKEAAASQKSNLPSSGPNYGDKLVWFKVELSLRFRG